MNCNNSTKKKFLILFLVACTFISIAYSSNVKFYNINSFYGISMREANAVCEDNNGFIWVSSITGILRLTDDDYRIYQLPYEIPNSINVKLIFNNSLLLAYTNNGQIFYYNRVRDRFDFIINLRRILKNNNVTVNNVLIDKKNTFWIATSVGFYKYQNKELSLISNIVSASSYATWYDTNRMILADKKGLSLFDVQTQNKVPLYKNKVLPPSSTISKLFYDKSQNKLWMGTISNGLYYYDFKTRSLTNIKIKTFPEQPILAIASISDSSLMIGIDGQGLWEINKKGDRVLNIYKESDNNPSSLRGNGVYDIFCDQNNRVWVCTYSGGVSYYEKKSLLVNQITHQVNSPNSLVNNDVNSIVEDLNGNIWFATNNGISCWEVSKKRWKSFYDNNQKQAQVFLTVREDNKGRIWAGTFSSGVYVLDEKTGKELAHYTEKANGSPYSNDFVFDIFKDSHGDIYYGGVIGPVICYKVNENQFQKYPDQSLYTIAELAPHLMLFGCTNGLNLLDKRTGNTKRLIDGCLIHDILVKDGIIWAATSGEGLIRYDPKNGKKESFTTQSGMPSNIINSVIYSDGYMWLGTENGLCRFDPVKKSVLTYSSILPLSRVSFNWNAHYKLRNGELVFGSNNGAVIFNPKTLQQYQSKGKIFFQDLTISGRSIRGLSDIKLYKPIDSLTNIKLKYNQNTLTLELIPIRVFVGSKFSWKMEGLDKGWSQPTNHRIITYANIPNDDFSLKIRMYNNSLSQLICERTLSITITPPFWKTWWFILLVLAVVSTFIYFALRYYSNLLHEYHNEAKMRFFSNTAHDFRTSLTLIKAPIDELTKEKNLSESGNYFLNLATVQINRLSSVVTQLMDFQKVDTGKGQLSFIMTDIVQFIDSRKSMFESLAKSQDIKLTYISDKQNYITAIDEKIMEKVIDNLISNALKYSSLHSEVRIELKCQESNWVLEVKDQGIGISKKEQSKLFKEFYRGENAINSKIVGSGIGLYFVKSCVQLHNGTISYSGQENIGSTFQIVIPYKEVKEPKKIIDSPKEEEFSPVFADEDSIQTAIQQEIQSRKAMSILIVEDNEDLRNFMEYTLKEDFEVYVSGDGVNAWKKVQKHLPDLIVSDVMMPYMDGFELCKLIKTTYETSHIPVILLTSLSGTAEQLNGLGLGADDYLTKPFDMSLLQQKIKSIILNREVVRDKALKLIKGSNDEPILLNELNNQFIKKMQKVVHNNISNTEFGKDEFASIMNVSTSLLYKKIKSLTNQSPIDFIKSVRLDYALELLKTRKYTVTEVSELCGFASVGYFGTVFKKYFRKSPTDILK
jgi:signal transduction histidine kinase/DNA-binding response OmpR family regulator/ligand-binding sensor domain-containing protein